MARATLIIVVDVAEEAKTETEWADLGAGLFAAFRVDGEGQEDLLNSGITVHDARLVRNFPDLG